MQFLIELIFELIPARIWGLLFAGFFIFLGVVVWQTGGEERAKYDAATGLGAEIHEAEIRRKVIRSESTSQINDHDTGSVDVNYLELSYYQNNEYKSLDVQVDRHEYDSVKEGQHIRISFHPGDPLYVVTPMKEKPGVLLYRLGAGVLFAVGALLILIVFFSLF